MRVRVRDVMTSEVVTVDQDVRQQVLRQAMWVDPGRVAVTVRDGVVPSDLLGRPSLRAAPAPLGPAPP
jgi:hypothetical protein